MGHQETYRHNQAYAEFLAGWDAGFYAKYADTLCPDRPGTRALDVGCGVGQVVARLTEAGFEAHGVDVSEPNIERAREILAQLDREQRSADIPVRSIAPGAQPHEKPPSPAPTRNGSGQECPRSERCQLYDGKTLPFPDKHFASVGALNVLEHVEEPEAFIGELVRVTEIGGRIVLSSPNFFRVLGFRDYHPKMRGLGNKWRNWRRLGEKRRQMRTAPESVRFDRMTPIVKRPFTPDDDAVVATNPLEMRFFLERAGCEVLSVACTDRYVAKPVDWALNLTSARYLMFNAFLVATRRK